MLIGLVKRKRKIVLSIPLKLIKFLSQSLKSLLKTHIKTQYLRPSPFFFFALFILLHAPKITSLIVIPLAQPDHQIRAIGSYNYCRSRTNIIQLFILVIQCQLNTNHDKQSISSINRAYKSSFIKSSTKQDQIVNFLKFRADVKTLSPSRDVAKIGCHLVTLGHSTSQHDSLSPIFYKNEPFGTYFNVSKQTYIIST